MTEDPTVLVPDRWGGLTVVSAADFLARLADDEPWEEALSNASFDSFAGDALQAGIERVRKLNETDDSTAYWRSEEAGCPNCGIIAGHVRGCQGELQHDD